MRFFVLLMALSFSAYADGFKRGSVFPLFLQKDLLQQLSAQCKLPNKEEVLVPLSWNEESTSILSKNGNRYIYETQFKVYLNWDGDAPIGYEATVRYLADIDLIMRNRGGISLISLRGIDCQK